MNKPVPWNVKGVGFDAREAARIAARRAGMPVGEWLNSVISERATALGVRTDEIDPDDRLETIAARLSEVDREASAPVLPVNKGQIGTRESANTTPPSLGDVADRAARRSAAADAPAALQPAGASSNAIRRSVVRGSSPTRSFAKSAAPSERPVDPIEPDDATRAVTATASARMMSGPAAAMRASASYGSHKVASDAIESALPQAPVRERVQDEWRVPAQASRAAETKRFATGDRVSSNSEGLDSRLTSILDKLNRSFEEAERFGREAASDTLTRSRTAAGSGRAAAQRDFRKSVDAISNRQVMLDAPLNEDLAVLDRRRRDDTGTRSSRNDRPVAAAPSKASETSSSGAAFADLHSAFKTLSDKLDTRLGGPAAPPRERLRDTDGSDYLSLKNDISGLADRIDRMRADSSGRETATRLTAELDKVRQEIAQLSTSLADLAPRQSLESLEAALRELTGRVDLSKLDGVQASVLAPVERLSREMREAIRSSDPSKTVDGLRREMAALVSKVEAIPLHTVNSDILDRMQAETREMREILGKATERLSVTDRLERELAKLGQQVDVLADRTTPTMSRDLALAVGDVRTLLKGFETDGVLGAIDRKVDTLAARIDDLSNSHARGDLFDDLSRQIDRAHESLAARLAPRDPGPIDLAPLEERIGVLSAKLDSVGRASHDVTALYGLVGGLVDRIDDARGPQADTEILNALQAQIGQLVDRLDRSEASHAMLSSLDQSIGDLFLQIEQSRNIAIDAAENAARTAAQDTLRAAMDNPTLNGGELAVQTGLDVDHVSQELSDLRRAHEASELRVNATLTALNSTLERLVDRLVGDQASNQAKAERPNLAPSSDAGDSLDVRPLRRRPQRSRSEQARGTRDEAPDQTPFDPNEFLLEPGSGPIVSRVEDRLRRSAEPVTAKVPAVDLGLGSVEEPASDVAPLIAAARRAAQAAQASALEATMKARESAEVDAGDASSSKTRSFFARRRRPLLLSLAGLVLLVGTLQIVKLSSEQGAPATPAAKDPGDLGSNAKSEPATSVPPVQSGVDNAKPASDSGSLLTPPVNGSGTPATFSAPAKSSDASQFAPATPDRSALAGLSQGLRDLAASGNPGAQFEVAVRLSEGRDVTRDAVQALSWFQRAAKQGLAPAQYRLGSLYEKGIGTAADPALAVAWYEKAAAQGNVRAMHNLAVMSAEGTGAKPDYVKAVSWFTKAANNGVRDSQFNLAVLYARGLGVTQSLPESYIWFSLAAGQGDKDALQKRDTVAAKLDAKGLQDAKLAVDQFRPIVPNSAANDVAPPPGGWDAVASPKTASGPNAKNMARLSSM